MGSPDIALISFFKRIYTVFILLSSAVVLSPGCGGGGGGGGNGGGGTPADTTAPVITFTAPSPSVNLLYDADPDDLPDPITVAYSDAGEIATSTFSSFFTFRGIAFNISALFSPGGASASTNPGESPLYWTAVSAFNTGNLNAGTPFKVFGVSSSSTGLLNFLESDPENDVLMVAATSRNRLIFIRLSDGSTLRETVLPEIPAVVRFCPSYKRVYVSFSSGSNIAVYNSETGNLQATIDLGVKPKSVVVNKASSKLYAIFENSTVLKAIDCSDNSIEDLTLSEIPHRLEVDNLAEDRLFYAGGIGINKGIYVRSEAGDLKVVSLQSLPEDFAYDSGTDRFFLAFYGSNSVSVYNAASGQQVGGAVSVGEQPFSIKAAASAGKIFVLNRKSDSVSVINASSAAVSSTLDLTADPVSMNVDSTNGKIYILQNIWQITGNEAASVTAAIQDESGNTGSVTLNMTIAPVSAGSM